jgi:hypothetical protein
MMNRDGAPKAAMRGTAALVLALAGLALSGCATLAPPASGPAPQKAAPSRAPSAQAPAWVLAPYGTYPESKYLATVGTGASKAEAEKSALAALGNTFGQSVSSQSSAVRHYAEAVKGGEIKVDKSLAMSESIDLSSGQKILLGAETKEAWIDGQGRHYVLVVMDKLKSGMAYSQLLDRNDEAVKALVSAEGAEKYSLDMYRRYGLAIDIADVDTQLAGTLSVLNPAAAAARQVSMGDEIRTQRLDIAQNIVFNVAVAGDRDNRIGQAISGVLTGRQFKAGEAAQARYRVEATLAQRERPRRPGQLRGGRGQGTEGRRGRRHRRLRGRLLRVPLDLQRGGGQGRPRRARLREPPGASADFTARRPDKKRGRDIFNVAIAAVRRDRGISGGKP